MTGRRAIGLVLRTAVAGAGLFLAFRLVLPADGAGALATLLGAFRLSAAEALPWFALAFAILGLNLGVGAVRFRGLLRGAGLSVGLALLFRAYLVASFFNLVLPGGMLGDVYRVLDARRDTGEGSRVLGVVALERVVSLAALGAVALLAAPAIPHLHEDRQLRIAVAAAAASVVAGAVGVLTPAVNRGMQDLTRRLAPLSASLSASGIRALEAVAALAAKPAVVLRAFAWSIVNQLLPIAALVALAVPLDAVVAWYWFAVIVPFVTLVSLLPISIGGTGVREVLYVALFGAVGMRQDAALALSLSVLAVALAWGAVGLLVFATGRRTDSSWQADPGVTP